MASTSRSPGMQFQAAIARRVASRLHAGMRVGLLLALLVLVSAIPAYAWKPNTHLYTANQAIRQILLGNNVLTVDGRSYPVDPRVAQAIRNWTAYYRGGVVGPDGFPDIYVGQAFIHPNTACNNGEWFENATDPSKRCNFNGGSFTYEWLRHVYEAGWQYYYERGGDARGQQALAFAYGYLTHAAGDMWGHTFVNDFAKGIFPPWTGGGDDNIGIRHFIVEGYVGKHTPHPDVIPDGTDPNDPQHQYLNSIEILSPTDTDPNDPHANFVFWAFIADGLHGGFVDSAGLDPRLLGRGVIFDFFYRIRDDLVVLENNPELILVKDCLFDPWIQGIDKGLQAWPAMSQKIAHSLFSYIDPASITEVSPGHFTGEAAVDTDTAKQAVTDYMHDYLPAMLGLDNCITDAIKLLIQPVVDLLDDIADLVQPLKDFVAWVQSTIDDAVEDMENWLLVQMTGHDIDYYKSILTSPCTYINSYPGLDDGSIYPALGGDTSHQMDALMGITDGNSVACDSPTFPEDQLNADTPFRAVRNTIVTSQLILLNTTDPGQPNALDQVLYDHRVGPIYRQGAPFSDRDNAMLGFIRSIDANQQWRRIATTVEDEVSPDGTTMVPRKNGEGMPLWLDCLARQRVFRTLFLDWQNGAENFPDQRDGHPETYDPALNISSTPSPSSRLTITGPTVTNGGKQYIGGDTTLTLAAQTNHYWDAGELTVFGTVTDPNGTTTKPSALGQLDLGPFSGPDGAYQVGFYAACTDCAILEAPGNQVTLYLDKTPPTITITSPLPLPPSTGQVLDVVNTTSLNYTVADSGSGVASSSATLDSKSFPNAGTIDAFYFAAGDHSIVVTATDQLGNQSTANDSFSVHATTAGLVAATTRGYNLGLITIPRSLNAWLANLQNADKDYQAGKISQAINQLQAASKLISSQLGSGIQTDLGNRMTGWINDLVARLQ